MSLPPPEPGLVVRYAYLWKAEFLAGREEGLKDRPCAIITVVIDDAGKQRVLVVPVTHTQPQDMEAAIEIPTAIKQHLGLDPDRSWVVLSESNYFQWPSPDLRWTGDHESIPYGFLPRGFFKKIREKFVECNRRRQTARIKRTH